MIANKMGHYYEEYKVGDVIKHQFSKTIFESDNNIFSLLTMNPHPVHTNIDYAENSQHGKILVVGTLVFSLVVGFSVSDISGNCIANLGYENIEHLKPVFVGDTLYAETEVLECRESKTKQDRGIIYVETRGYNQQGDMVIRFRRRVLMKKESYYA